MQGCCPACVSGVLSAFSLCNPAKNPPILLGVLGVLAQVFDALQAIAVESSPATWPHLLGGMAGAKVSQSV